MLHGLRTAKYAVDDVQEAKAWYTEITGKEPYFDEPYYVGFNVGGYELGLVPANDRTDRPGPGGVVAYWGVDDITAAVDRLKQKGATVHEDIQDVGEGIRLATVKDPFGNLLGVIENPNYEVE